MAEIIFTNVGAQSRAEIVRGTAWAYVVQLWDDDTDTAENIAGRSYSSQFRTTGGALVATATCTITSASAGKFSIALSDAQTLAFVAGNEYTWSIVQTNAGVREELVRGDVTVYEGLTT